jgi:cytochrome c oxidase subunit II
MRGERDYIIASRLNSSGEYLSGNYSRCQSCRHSLSTLLRFGCLFSIFLFFNGCAGRQSALDPAGPQAERIGHLWWFMFWTCTGVFIVVMGVLYLAIRRGRKHHKMAENSEQAAQPLLLLDADSQKPMLIVIGSAVALTVVILFAMLIFDFATGRGLKSLASPEPVVIQLTGHQWWWDVRYDDPIPANIVTTANEIHIPVGQPILLKSTSTDVIHSFWVPNLHGKKDMIPGQQTLTWFQADKAGVYRGQCAEFCGYQHAKMALLVIVESLEDFNAWLAHQRQAAISPTNAEQQRGQQVFLSSPCVMCHTIRGTLASSRFGPDLTHLADRQMIAAATLPNTQEHLAEWISNSQESKPGNRMPPVALAADDLQSLLTYLQSLK